MVKLRISFSLDAEQVGDILSQLTNEQIATMQLVPDIVASPTSHPFSSYTTPQQALQQAFESVRTAKSTAKPATPRHMNAPSFKPGSATDLMYKFIKRAKGERVSISDINTMLEKHNLQRDTSSMRRLIELGLVKRVSKGEYVYIGED